MRLWLSRGSEISVRDQLVTQIVLSILGGDLKPGQRLPSTRELARRFHVHANTISSGYRELERNGWVEFRKGSGIYVRSAKPVSAPAIALDQLIAEFFNAARNLGMPLSIVREHLRRSLESQPPDHFLLIEPDPDLAAILVHEAKAAIAIDVRSCQPEGYNLCSEGAIPISVSFSLKSARAVVPKEIEILSLQLRSAGASLAQHLPASTTALVGIASGWAPFLKNARTMLVAAGFAPDCLVLRDTTKPNWRRGLAEAAAVVCDSLTAQALDGAPRALRFALLSESSLKELRNYEQFIRLPLAP